MGSILLSPLQLVKRTPLANCGQCGHPTCLAFAAAVLKVGLPPTACPFIDLAGLDFQALNTASDNIQHGQKDLEFIAFLKDKIAACDFTTLAGKLGANYIGNPQPALALNYLGQDVVISKKDITIDGREPSDHRDKILLYNYVSSGDSHNLAGDWLGLESLPNAISKVKTLATYCEDRLARILDHNRPEKFNAIIKQLNGREAPDNSASLSTIIPVLPMLPQYLLFWEAEPEDNFAAKVKILFDTNVMDILDLESLVFAAERLADRIELLWQDE
ncbi:MAG: DUF3786 domain-containing protein [Deltaproteobacteria bacterium]|nr:DUF3786 domain-containing protein [Deltaproteobacteria bacterium]